MLLKDEKIPRRGWGSLGCSILEEFPPCTLRKMYAPVYDPCLYHCASICKLPGFGSINTYTF